MKCGCFLILICAAVSHAQTTEQRGKKIIDEAVAALGGENFLKMEDRIESGRAYSFYRDELTGLSIAKIYTRYLTVPPNKSGEVLGQRERQVFGKNEDSSTLFLENGAWEINWRGSKELPKDRVDRYRESMLRNIFYILRQRLNEPGMIFELRGAEVFENQPVDIIDITDSQNRMETVYFHQSTHLPVRQMYSRRNAETKERDDEVTRFSRYRLAPPGVQWPHQILRERNGDKIYEIFSESVSINQGLTDNIFALPEPGGKPAEKGPKKK